jgi:hypothetical protein
MQRGIRKHEPQSVVVGSDAWNEIRIWPPGKDDDGTTQVAECSFVSGEDFAQRSSGGNIADHESKGLMRAVFAAAKFSHCGFIGSVTCEQETSETFDGENLSFAKKITGVMKNGE